MKQLPETLDQSYCYISNNVEHQKRKTRQGWQFELGGWFPQRQVSRSVFGSRGEATIRACEAYYGNFVWATEFSNVHSTFFYDPKPIVIDGEEWSNSEAYYQAMKSFGMSDHEEAKKYIQTAGPMEAWRIGQRYSLRPDWRDVSVEAMGKAVEAKFTQDENLRGLLLSTREYPLVQVKPSDAFWGTGFANNGKNMLGILLMSLRSKLR